MRREPLNRRTVAARRRALPATPAADAAAIAVIVRQHVAAALAVAQRQALADLRRIGLL